MRKDIDVGASAEHFLAGELLALGVMCCWPSSQSQPYDLIADLGKNRYKIQVKGTKSTASKVYFQFVRRAGGRKRRIYNKTDTDFVILYVFAYDVWYVFPIKDVRNAVTVRPGRLDCKYAKYLNAWHLLDSSLK